MEPMEYGVTRTCGDCAHADIFEFTKAEVAFKLYNANKIWNTPCSICGSRSCSALSHQLFRIDQELLNLWGQDLSLSFDIQDEHIILADMAYLDIILKSIDEGIFLQKKIDILTSALCILMYDNIVSPEEYTDSENQERMRIANLISLELKKRSHSIIRAKYLMSDYIKELVFPRLELQ